MLAGEVGCGKSLLGQALVHRDLPRYAFKELAESAEDFLKGVRAGLCAQ